MYSFVQERQIKASVERHRLRDAQWHDSRSSDKLPSDLLPVRHNDEEKAPKPPVSGPADGGVVTWTADEDHLNPKRWPIKVKVWNCVLLWVNVFTVDWGASADSQNGAAIARAFNVSSNLEVLSSSLFSFGIGLGALFAGPISETVGRNPVYIYSRILNFIWLIGVAVAPNFAAQIAFRFLAGASASILLAVHAASVVDMFDAEQRTIVWPLIALSSFLATTLSPACGDWIAAANYNWRIAEWIAAAQSGFVFVLSLFFLRETFTPILLRTKAKYMQQLCDESQQAIIAEIDLRASLRVRLGRALKRAAMMATREPIAILLSTWLVLVYAAIYSFLEGFDFIFGDTYGQGPSARALNFVAIAIGTCLWTILTVLCYFCHCYFRSKNTGRLLSLWKALTPAEAGPGPSPPEHRLWAAWVAAPAFPISLFWLAWTNYESISSWSGWGAVALLGLAWAGIYMTVYQYFLDVYDIYAGSALAALTSARYLMSGAANLFAKPLYQALGVHWTVTVLGIIAALLMLAPLLLYRYGPALRERSPFACGT